MSCEEEKNSIGTVSNARSAEQAEHMRDLARRGVCPFCTIGPLNSVLWSGEHWRMWANPFPYRFHQHHFVIASILHWVGIEEITPAAWAEWGMLNALTIRERKIQGGGLVMRFGDSKLSGASLLHVHSHLQVPDQRGPAITVFFKDSLLDAFLKSLPK